MIEFEKEFFSSKGKPFEKNGRKYHLAYEFVFGELGVMTVTVKSHIDKPLQGIRFDSSDDMVMNEKKGIAFVV